MRMAAGPRAIGALAAAAGCACAALWYMRSHRRSRSIREHLAAAHALSAHYGFDELIWNHISARIEEGSSNFLVTPGTQHFDEVRRYAERMRKQSGREATRPLPDAPLKRELAYMHAHYDCLRPCQREQ